MATIVITDTLSKSSTIGVGFRTPPFGNPPTGVAQTVIGWKANVKFDPGAFPVHFGGSDYDTGALFCFANNTSNGTGPVLIVLWAFPSLFKEGDNGDGRLNKTPSGKRGRLVPGDITWKVVGV
jgi:hypothetical protein